MTQRDTKVHRGLCETLWNLCATLYNSLFPLLLIKNQQTMKEENRLSEIIIGCAIKVHRRFGPGLLESAYQECLIYELKKAGLKIEKEKSMPIVYDEVKLDHGYRIDILVENKVVVELSLIHI